jgi:hypothetical protein
METGNKILYHAEIVNSKTDVNGNRYFCMIVTRNSDGLRASGIISGGQSYCTYAMRELTGGEWGRFSYTVVELPIREYNRLVKNMGYIGCTAEEIIASLKFA